MIGMVVNILFISSPQLQVMVWSPVMDSWREVSALHLGQMKS
jgi:hypothetical protein